jgi:hypothetical protein
MQFLEQARAWLASQNPDLPWALLTVVALFACYLWRRFWPASWERWAAWLPKSDTSKLWNLARKVLQAWPSAAIGVVLPALSSGGDIGMALKGATFGLLAPLLYEAAKLAKTVLGKGGPGSGVAAIVCALAISTSVACSPAPLKPPCDEATLAAMVAECAARVELECASRDIPEADCQVLKQCDERLDERARVCSQ